MAYVDKINVQGTDYDINDKRLPDVGGVVTLNAGFTANDITEKMTGYSFYLENEPAQQGFTLEGVYAGVVKNGNKLTIVFACNLTKTSASASGNFGVGDFLIPSSVGAKLFANIGEYNLLDVRELLATTGSVSIENNKKFIGYFQKSSNTQIRMVFGADANDLVLNTKYYVRYEATFLLSDNLIPQQ